MTKTLTPKKILVVKNRAMGDAVLGLSALQYLQQIYPDATLSYAVPDWMAGLFQGEKSLIEEVVPLRFKTALDWWKSFSILRKYHFDLILELNQSGRSGNFFNLYSKISGTPYFFHNHNLASGDFVHDQGKRKPNIARDLDLVYSYAQKISGMNLLYPHHFQFEPYLGNKKNKEKKIVLGVVATRETKMWPSSYWQDFIKSFHSAFPEWIVQIPFSSSELDQKIKKEIFPGEIPAFVEILEMPLAKLKERLQATALYIGNDTGIKHLSIALGMQSISFFGPEEPLEWHPYDLKRHSYFFVEPLECRTLYSHFCGLNHCSVMACMKSFTPELVMGRVQKILA